MEDKGAEIWYRLSSIGDPVGLSCDECGVFLGGVPLLEHAPNSADEKRLTPRPIDDLSREFGMLYGVPIDMGGKQGGLSTVANALNRGNLALAKIASVQMRLPDLPRFSAMNENAAKLVSLLRRGGLLKEAWDPAKHPRWPAGSPDSQGGEFAPADSDSSDTSQADGTRSPSPIVSDRCAEEWADAHKFCGGLLLNGLLGTSGYRGFGWTYEQCVRGMVSAACGGNPVG